MNKLKPEEQKTLREAQKTWIKHRDDEFKLLDAIYAKKDGTMYLPMRGFDRIKIISDRVNELEKLIDLIDEN
jgi:uncharacterized protein YecT (DUF1311 family)